MTELNETARFPRARFRTKRGRPGFHSPASPRIIAPLRNTRHPQLNDAIEAEIIPRLVMAHASALERVPAIITASAQEAADFAELVLDADDVAAVACIQAHRDHGETLERIYLDLLVPTANHLRHLWADDERDFADVTLALWRLQQLLRHFSSAFCAELSVAPAGLRVLLTTAPGDRTRAGPHDVRSRAGGRVLPSRRLRDLDRAGHSRSRLRRDAALAVVQRRRVLRQQRQEA
ncbi:B12-binding domain-containing protein [Bradyrhizobium oligotrophicum S58]